MNAEARAFWKGSVITGAAVLLLSALVIAGTLTVRPSATTSDARTPAPTVTATVPGPTITATAAATVQGPEVTVTASPAAVPKSCRDALVAADKVMLDKARNQAIQGQALIDAGRTGDPSVLYAAITRMKAMEPADNADLSEYAAAKTACNDGG